MAVQLSTPIVLPQTTHHGDLTHLTSTGLRKVHVQLQLMTTNRTAILSRLDLGVTSV